MYDEKCWASSKASNTVTVTVRDLVKKMTMNKHLMNELKHQ
jgi:hypothetical protein